MYFTFRTWEDVKNELMQRQSDYLAKLKAWENVTIEKKKNGEEFAQIGRALKNAKIGAYYPVEDAGHPYITIFYKSDGYKSDSIPIYFNDDELPNDGVHRDKLCGGYYTKDTFAMTHDDIRKKIQNIINVYANYADALSRQLQNGEKIFNDYRGKIKKADDELAAADMVFRNGGIFPSSLFYLTKETR